ncbi:RloB family protein [Morganella morganii]|uniref:RloB family protein n=3 Tax=Enterobacterales TaxID=91347 RepID=UPI003119B70D
MMAKKKTKEKSVPPVMYIYCEGEKTEPLYLEAYISDRDKKGYSVFKIPKTRKNSPEQLVDLAIEKKKESSADDVFWVVYDQEQLTSQSKSSHQRAWNKANKNNINIAISCVCFELWILMHFGYTTKEFISYKDLISSSPLKKLIPDYDKGSKNTYYFLKEKISDAKENSKRLSCYAKHNNATTTPEYLYKSYTNFHDLLENIDSF